MTEDLEARQNPGIVEVVWLDSLILNHGEWMDLDDLLADLKEESMVHNTVGYLLADTDVAIAIGLSINAQYDMPTNRVSGGMIIPKSAIKSMTTLREKA